MCGAKCAKPIALGIDLIEQPTDPRWYQTAVGQLDLLLIDHAHCEKKAASTAMNLLYRYVDRHELLVKLAQLAREELLHFEQVVDMMAQKGVSAPIASATSVRALSGSYASSNACAIS